ncbi:MAG: DNA-processing protein DprA [Spirochaeta sp.]
MLELAMALQHLPFLATREQLLLQEIYSGIEDLRKVSARDLLQAVGRPYRGQSFQADELIEQVRRELAWMPTAGISPVHLWSTRYPALLREISDPPVVLYIRGDLCEKPCVSVVGTRRPTTEGRQAAYSVGQKLVRLGYAVVSGLALGIDAAAHAGALQGGGTTIAVLGSGVDRIYPRSNSRLASRMMVQGGSLISEFPPGTMPRKHHFPQRNRIIAGLSALTIVVEAPRGSGALITADYAIGRREVMVHKAGYESVLGDGCRELVLDGAGVLADADELAPAFLQGIPDEY